MLTRTKMREFESVLKANGITIVEREPFFTAEGVDFTIVLKMTNCAPKKTNYSTLLKKYEFNGDVWSYFQEK